MRLWALSDPHLTLATPSKVMHVFGEQWRDHEERIAKNWAAVVRPEDVVVVPGDISWASRLDDALTDLHWLDRLPGTKILLEGNHERWWTSIGEVRRHLPPSVHALDGDHIEIGPWLFFGTRLWEDQEIEVDSLIAWNRLSDKRPENRTEADRMSNLRIYERQLGRLERCIRGLPRSTDLRKVCLTHYPPIGEALTPTRASQLIMASGATWSIFGHLHSILPKLKPPFGDLMGTAEGVRYILASCDYRDFKPVLIDQA